MNKPSPPPIRHGPSSEALSHFRFTLRPSSTPLLAIRLRRRSYADGNRPLILIEERDALRWSSLGLPFTFWMNTHPSLYAAFKVRFEDTSKTVGFARFVLDCKSGEGVRYLNSWQDLRRTSLTLCAQHTAGPAVTDVIASARTKGYHHPAFHDWYADLVEPRRVDIDRMVEKGELP